MTMETLDREPLALAGQTLRVSYNRALNFVMLGRLDGRRVRGRWFVTRVSIQRLAEELEQERRDEAA